MRTVFDLYSSPDFRVRGVLNDAFLPGKLLLHLDWDGERLTLPLYKKMLLAMAKIRRGCREQGIEKLYVLVVESLEHFENMFGFGIEVEYQHDLVGRVLLMSQDTNDGS